MITSSSILRILVLGVKTQRPRRYYLGFQALAPGATAAGAIPTSSYATDFTNAADAAHQTNLVCRTETASVSNCPEFTNRAFVLRLPTAVPGASSSSIADAGGPKVAIVLLAAPTLDEPVPQIVAGKEVDQVVAAGYLELSGDVAARLATGQRATVPVQLHEVTGQNVQLASGLGGQAAQLQNSRSSKATNVHSGTGDAQVLLELLLLDTGQLMQSSMANAAAAAAVTDSNAAIQAARLQQQPQQQLQRQQMQQMQQQQQVGRPAAAAAAAAAVVPPAEPEAVLSVVVSAAMNLPMVPGSNPDELVPPSAFVALKSAADAAAKRPAQAKTAAVQQTQNPVWGELLTVSYPEAELLHEQLLIAVVHSSNNRVLVKGAMLLSGLIPGQHYSLALMLSESCILYINMHLGLGASTQIEALQGSGMVAAAAAGQLKFLQIRLSASQPPLQSLALKCLQQQQQQQAGRSEVWAIWRSSPRQISSAGGSSSSWQQPLHATVDCREGREKNAVSIMRNINGRSGLLAAAAVEADDDDATNDYVIGALPIQALTGSIQQLWPVDHMVLLPCWLSTPTAAVLELFVVTYPTNSSSTSNKPANPKAPPQQQQQPRAVCFARLQLANALLNSQQSGQPFLLQDLALTDAAAAAADLSVAAVLGKASFECITWDVVAYVEHLKQLIALQQQEAAVAAAANQRALQNNLQQSFQQAEPDSISLQQQQQHLDNSSSIAGLANAFSTQQIAAAPDVHVTAMNNMLDTLVSDVTAKQQALEKIQRALDVAESRREIATCQIGDLQDKNSRLTADLQHLRQLLHDEKEAAAAAFDGNSIAALAAKSPSKDDLFHQLGLLAAALAKERTRNAELVHRLQQLHAEQIDVLELQKRYAELQEAHYQQSQLLADQETNMATIKTLKKAVTDQESVITRLEKLLAAAVCRSKELEGWKTTSEAWQAEASRLREELNRLAAAHPADDIAQAASKAAAAVADQQAAAAALTAQENAAAQAKADYETKLAAMEADRLSALMRVEKAEAAATAAHNELLDVTKRYAREVAQLKTKLAEKDAQLLGGFGSLASLQLGELGPSTNSLNPGPNLAMPGLNPNAAFSLGLDSGQHLGFGNMGLGGELGLGQPWQQQQPLQQGLGSGRFDKQYSNLSGALGGSTHDRMQSYSPVPGSTAAAAGRMTGSPRLEALAGPGSSSSNSLAQQQSLRSGHHSMRAGTAEGSPSRKPGSPLAPILQQQQQQRYSTSAEGLRSGTGSLNAAMTNPSAAAAAAAVGIGSPGRRTGSPGGSLRRTGSPAAVAGGYAAADSPIRRTGSPAGAAAAMGMGSPVRGGMASGRPTGSPMMQQPRSPLLSGATAPDDGIFSSQGGTYDDGDEYEDGDEDDEYEGSDEDPQEAYHQQQQQQQRQPVQQQPGGVARSGQASMRQQQQQYQGGAGATSSSPQPAAKSGLRKWFG